MDILPSGNIFRELQDIHETGYFSAQPTLEENWQQINFATGVECNEPEPFRDARGKSKPKRNKNKSKHN